MTSNGENELQQTTSARAAPRSGLLAVLAAPWIAPISATRAGRILAGAGPVSAALAVAMCLFAAAAVLTFIFAWDLKKTLNYELMWGPAAWPPAAASMPTTAAATQPASAAVLPARRVEDAIIVRSFAEVWRQSDSRYGFGLGGMFAGYFIVVAMIGLMGYAVVAICTAPRFYDGSGLGRWAKTAAVAPLGGVWAVLPAMLAVGATIVMVNDWHDRIAAERWAQGDATGAWWFPQPAMVVSIAVLCVAAGATVIVWSQRTGMAVATCVTPAADVPGVRCTGCDYSLEHVPSDGRCPECGADATRSLSSEARPGLDWQSPAADPALAFIRTHVALLFRPSKSYALMRTRRHPDRAWRFEFVQFMLATVATIVAFDVFILFDSPRGVIEWDELLLGVMAGAIAGLIGFLGHRLAAAIALSATAATQPAVDGRALAATVGYQSVWVWSFFVWNFSAAFTLSGGGMETILDGLESAFGISRGTAEAVTFISVHIGNLVLALLWLYRHQIAFRAVRWANY